MKKVFTFIVLLVGLMMTASGTLAQECPTGLEGDACDTYQTALANSFGAGSFELDFTASNVVDVAGALEFTVNATGSGPVQVDFDGNLVTAELLMPEAGINFGGMLGGMLGGSAEGAAGFVLLDGIMYFGIGESTDSLTWESLDLSEYDLSDADLTLTGATETTAVAEWTSSEEGDLIVLSNALEETALADLPDDVIGESLGGTDDPMIGALLGDLGEVDGTVSGENTISINTADISFANVSSSINITIDTEAMMEEMGDVEGMEGLFDGDTTADITFDVSFSDYFTAVEVEAPADAEPMDEFTAQLVVDSASNGLAAMLTSYYQEVATVMGDDSGGGLGLDECGTEGYTVEEGGSLSYGDTGEGEMSLQTVINYTFEGSAGDTVSIEMVSPDDFDTCLDLYGPEGELVANNDDSMDMEGYNSRIGSFELSADGTYTIGATSFFGSGEGPFTLTLTSE